MRVSILDDYQNVIRKLDCFKLLDSFQVTVLHTYISNTTELASQLKNPEILVLTRTRTQVDEALLKLLPNLKIISQTGKNAGHIDMNACKKYRVTVLEGKGNPIAPAELTWILIMNGLRKIPEAIEGMKQGKWQTNIGRRVYGKTIGIWGYGKIGKRIAQYAKAFEANVQVWGSEASRGQATKDGFIAINSKRLFFKTSDVVTLHLRYNEHTKGIVKQTDLLQMKSDALLVNTSRAGLIEEKALLQALKKGTPGFAAIDVYDEEPIFDPNFELFEMPNVICTPHIGYTEQAGYELYFSDAFNNILEFLNATP